MRLQFADNMHSNKRACAPIYFEPQTIKDSALIKLDALQSLKQSQEWVDDSTIFLNEDGSFSHEVIEEGSFKARLDVDYWSHFLHMRGSGEGPKC
ncbi:hypothetical protein FOPG_19745 [Fusarium oxysporum f. sp. conglutinans race 2 54008]|uniref:Uncharacterized protein n=1 Tax=Fusarium oxysporum f. sp. conglutinans race 2 54008 TaxID=1089457 RepID=X0GVP0_FUSOX|nr:hypothetical protein FOPG_19745 [Fusarium oxysporum f. sp. conglutinans race 2 54008]